MVVKLVMVHSVLNLAQHTATNFLLDFILKRLVMSAGHWSESDQMVIHCELEVASIRRSLVSQRMEIIGLLMPLKVRMLSWMPSMEMVTD